MPLEDLFYVINPLFLLFLICIFSDIVFRRNHFWIRDLFVILWGNSYWIFGIFDWYCFILNLEKLSFVQIIPLSITLWDLWINLGGLHFNLSCLCFFHCIWFFINLLWQSVLIGRVYTLRVNYLLTNNFRLLSFNGVILFSKLTIVQSNKIKVFTTSLKLSILRMNDSRR